MHKTLLSNLLFLFMAILAVCPTYAQSRVEQLREKVDAAQGEQRVILLDSLAQEVEKEGTEDAKELTKEGLSLARTLSYDYGIGRMLFRKGVILYREGRLDESITLVRQSKVYFDDQKDQAMVLQVYAQAGQVLNRMGSLPESLDAWQQALEIALETENHNEAGRAYSNIAALFSRFGNIDKAVSYEQNALEQHDKSGDPERIATSLNNLGDYYKESGMYEESIKHLKDSREINLLNDDTLTLIYNYATLGEVYQAQGDLDSAFYYSKLSLGLAQEIKEPFEIAYGLNDIGRVLNAMGKPRESLTYLRQAYQLANQQMAEEIIELTLENLYMAFHSIGRDDSAFFYQNKFLEVKNNLWENDANRMAEVQAYYNNERQQAKIDLLNKENQLKESELSRKTLFNRIIIVSTVLFFVLLVILLFRYMEKKRHNQQLKSKNREIAISNGKIYSQKIQLERALNNIKLLNNIGKDVTSNLSLDQIIETVYKHINTLMDAPVFRIGIYNPMLNRLEFAADREEGKVLEVHTKKISAANAFYFAVRCFQQKEEIWVNDFPAYLEEHHKEGELLPNRLQTGSLIFLPLLLKDQTLGVISVQSFQKEAYQEEHLSVLRNLASYLAIALENAAVYKQLSMKNNEVVDSINYASRIQQAMFPKVDGFQKMFEDSFIMLKPTGAVSGDFYWFAEKEGKKVVAAVDCTGHGVPGAFMSMIGMEQLTEIVNLLGITTSGKVLNRLDEGVRHILKQEETKNQDGMDMSLCVVSQLGEDVIEVDFSGAKNPLVYVMDGEVHTIKADRASIGGLMPIPEGGFSTHKLTINHKEHPEPVPFYQFSDGYQDQFGGENGKKFSIKQLREVIREIHKMPMADQKKIFEEKLAEWMDSEEQIDDILLIGFKL